MRKPRMTVAVLLLALSLSGCGYNTFQRNDEGEAQGAAK